MGRWVQFDTSYRSYVNPQNIHCEACGKMVPKDAWMVNKNKRELAFCNKECEKMFDYMKFRRKK